jgi:nucleoside-diphosphate-sugar epimerase
MGTAAAVVVGGTGFLGRHICAALADRGYDVVALARRSGPAIDGARLVQLDVARTTPDELLSVLRGADVVIGAAGDAWSKDETRLATAHIATVERLLAAMVRMPGRPRLVHLGTVHEYGPVPAGAAVAEDWPAVPATPHARSKYVATEAVLRAAQDGSVDGCVLRIANTCGPGTPGYSFLGQLTAGLRERAADALLHLTVADDRRDYVDARDVADAVVRAAAAPVVGRVINVGSGTVVSVQELVDLLVRISGTPPHLVHASDGAVDSRGGNWTRLDITAAGRLLGWSPRLPLEVSLRDTWQASGTAFGPGDPGHEPGSSGNHLFRADADADA